MATSNEPRRLKLGVYQSNAGRAFAASMELAIRIVEQGAKTGCDVVIFCELFLNGYGNSADEIIATAITPHDLGALQDACRRHRVGAVVGYAERDDQAPDDLPFNSMSVIDPEGNLVVTYRKTHLWGDVERRIFRAGDRLGPVFNLRGIPTALLICYDVEFPETVRTLKMMGAELILVPTALVSAFNAMVTVPSRAFENHCFIAYVNEQSATSSNTPFCGLSCVVGPDGSELVRFSAVQNDCALGGAFGIAQIEPDRTEYAECISRNPYSTDRRPELYRL